MQNNVYSIRQHHQQQQHRPRIQYTPIFVQSKESIAIADNETDTENDEKTQLPPSTQEYNISRTSQPITSKFLIKVSWMRLVINVAMSIFVPA